jgi:hypothetical protein
MIHVATVHWNDPRWIDIQHRYLGAHLSEEFRVYAFLNGIEDVATHSTNFFYVSTEPIDSHAIKLNILADIISYNILSDSDLLLFIDGDAFPIADVAPFLRATLADFPLLAVQRLENNGDIQPHPCFCATTVGFWKKLGGDWKSGYQWRSAHGELTTDVGGNLLGQLDRAGIRWFPLRRSNRVNLHPLWFGVYHGLVYHHGAAFREHPWSRLDLQQLAAPTGLPYMTRLKTRIFGRLSYHFKLHWLDRFSPSRQQFDATVEHNRKLISDMFRAIQEDPEFYQSLIGTGPQSLGHSLEQSSLYQ